MDGILRCSRYAFGPNRLHYCGPDANSEIAAYINENHADPGLEKLLSAFRTMFPYLKFIAESNRISDPFDERVVEAYWLGNELLDRIEKGRLYRHLIDDHGLKKKIGAGSMDDVADKIAGGALPHHSFHVLDIWKRTGTHDIAHTLESMDACRISWGKITEIDGPMIKVMSEPLHLVGGRLQLGPPEKTSVKRRLDSLPDIDRLKVGDLITMHWGVPCEAITHRQATYLRKYTLHHLELADQR